jgi:hypothetical protein
MRILPLPRLPENGRTRIQVTKIHRIMVTIFLHILKFWVQISDQRLLILTEVFVVFLNVTLRSLPRVLPNSFMQSLLCITRAVEKALFHKRKIRQIDTHPEKFSAHVHFNFLAPPSVLW